MTGITGLLGNTDRILVKSELTSADKSCIEGHRFYQNSGLDHIDNRIEEYLKLKGANREGYDLPHMVRDSIMNLFGDYADNKDFLKRLRETLPEYFKSSQTEKETVFRAYLLSFMSNTAKIVRGKEEDIICAIEEIPKIAYNSEKSVENMGNMLRDAEAKLKIIQVREGMIKGDMPSLPREINPREDLLVRFVEKLEQVHANSGIYNMPKVYNAFFNTIKSAGESLYSPKEMKKKWITQMADARIPGLEK